MIAPVTKRTISSPLLDAQREKSVSGATARTIATPPIADKSAVVGPAYPTAPDP
jgi:hypothetical protein